VTFSDFQGYFSYCNLSEFNLKYSIY